MHSSFATIGQTQTSLSGDNSFWPSFTDIMMVITMIFLMATSLLVVRNWQLVAELQESVAAERLAAQVIESTTQVNATLEERLVNAEQANSILRLRLMQRDESLQSSKVIINRQELKIADLKTENTELQQSLQKANTAIAMADEEIASANTRYQNLSDQVSLMNEQVRQQKLETDQALRQLELAMRELQTLTASSQAQQQDITKLTQEKLLLNREVAKYNQELLSLKGDYEVIKSKYQELIKPARSAKGKYIAEVYYVKGKNGKVIRYKQPGDTDFTNLPLKEVEKRLDQLKAEKGKDLYVKIIIPEDSGLTYSEAWDFMRNLLVKYDYYYQE